VAERGPAVRIRLRPAADFSVSGHQLTAPSLTLELLTEDDTEGHTISLHFPKWEDAREFERRLIATGAIVGTMVIAGGGLALSQAQPDAGATTSTGVQVESPSTGGALTGKQEALLNTITGADAAGSSAQVGASSGEREEGLSGKEKGVLNAIDGD
jgi:hypothetical protein